MPRLALVFCSPVICLSVCLSVHLSFYQSVSSIVFLSVCPFICLCVFTCVFPSVLQSVSMTVHLSLTVLWVCFFFLVHRLYTSVGPSFCLSISVVLSVSLCPSGVSVSLSICQSFSWSVFHLLVSVFLSIMLPLYWKSLITKHLQFNHW